MVPLFATVLAWLTLGDWPRPIIAVGGPMILGGILLGQRGASSEDEDSSEA
jgi:drug/metabolite transporter (DMT)-like permease